MGVLWDDSLVAFLVCTVFLGGGAAFLTGRAMAKTWRPIPLLVFYCFLIALVVRFLHYALYEGELLTLYYFTLHLVLLIGVGIFGYQLYRARQMVRQYSWINQDAGPMAWKVRNTS
jgi:hypothetical protein